MHRVVATIFLLIIIAVVGAGCGSSGTPGPIIPPGMAAADAQSTIIAYNLPLQHQQTQTAEAVRVTQEAQAVSVRATQEAQAATAFAQEQQRLAAEATATALSVLEQELAIQQAGTAAAISAANLAAENSAAATAAAQFSSVEATRKAIENENYYADVEREKTLNAALPFIVGIPLLAIVAIAAAVARRVWVQTRPIPISGMALTYNRGEPRIIDPNYGRRRVQPPAAYEQPALPAQTWSNQVAQFLPEPKKNYLIAGASGAGKSNVARNIIAQRTGHQVIALDPHTEGGNDWGAADVFGGGRQFEVIAEKLREFLELMDERYKIRNHNTDGINLGFEPITIIIDELPAIIDAVGNEVKQMWTQLAREGRKVEIYLVLCTHGVEVTTMGIRGQGQVRESLQLHVYMGKLAITYASPETKNLVRSMNRPTILIDESEETQPVIVPYVDPRSMRPARVEPPYSNLPLPEDPVSGQWRPLEPAQSNSRPPRDPRNPDQETIRLICDLFSAQVNSQSGISQRAIERQVFGETGWEFHNCVRDVIIANFGEDALRNR